MKRLSNKYGKNSKNNKFNKILHLERDKVKNGFVKSANFAKIKKHLDFSGPFSASSLSIKV